jgi:hypothetical protein
MTVAQVLELRPLGLSHLPLENEAIEHFEYSLSNHEHAAHFLGY